MSLFEDLCEIAENIKKHRNAMNGREITTEQVSIEPFIDALGYDTKNPAEVRKQYVILNSDAVDFAVLRDGAPIIVLEGKKASEKLRHKYWKQLFEYFNADKARIGILTNGIAYRFYTDMDKSNIMDEQPFLEIDLLDLDKQTVEILEGFTKAQFDPIKSIHFMKISAKVERILSWPDQWLVRHVIYNVYEGSRSKKVIEEYRPLVKQAIDDYVARCETEPKPPPPDPIEPDPEPPLPPDLHLPKPQTWLDGSVKIPVYATWEGTELSATLRLYGKISNNGKLVLWDGKWEKPLTASREARKTVDPNTPWYVNGMTFWHFRDPADGKLRPINDLYYAWKNDWDLILRVITNGK